MPTGGLLTIPMFGGLFAMVVYGDGPEEFKKHVGSFIWVFYRAIFQVETVLNEKLIAILEDVIESQEKLNLATNGTQRPE